jgi:hypothetical protein
MISVEAILLFVNTLLLSVLGWFLSGWINEMNGMKKQFNEHEKSTAVSIMQLRTQIENQTSEIKELKQSIDRITDKMFSK